MNTTAILVLIISVTLVLGGAAGLSVYFTRRGEGSWALRKTPMIVTIGTTFATAIGGGVLVYHIGIAYAGGFSALTYGLCQGGGIFLLIIIARWLRENEFTTVPDIFEKIYGKSKLLMAIVAIASIVTPFGWVAGQCVAFAKLFSEITGIPIPILTAVFALVCLAFVLPAGFATVAWSDAIFGFLMAFVCCIAVFFALNMAGGWSTVVATVPREITRMPGALVAIGGSQVALWVMSVMPGQLTNQMYIQRISAVKEVRDVRKTLAIACILIFAADIFASFMGLSIRSMMPGLEQEAASGWFLTQVPVWFMALYVGLVGAAIMSTCDSAVHSVVVSLVYDLYKKLLNPEATERRLSHLSRWCCVFVLLISVILGLVFPNVLNLITTGYSYGVALLLFPMFVGYFLRKRQFVTRPGCYASMVAGTLGCLIFQIIGTEIPFVMFGLIFSLVALVLVSFLTKNKFYAGMAQE